MSNRPSAVPLRRKFGIAVIIVLLLISLLSVLFCTKFGMCFAVKIGENQLQKLAESLLSDAQSDTAFVHSGYRVSIYQESKCVFFESVLLGYKGLYYASNGNPVGYQGADLIFEKHNRGWKWVEDTGDNWMYTEHIVGNWYWYEMHF